jgi:hypothetical protein
MKASMCSCSSSTDVRSAFGSTGVSVFAVQPVAKRLELAREFAPDGVAIAFLTNPNNSNYKIDIRDRVGNNRLKRRLSTDWRY